MHRTALRPRYVSAALRHLRLNAHATLRTRCPTAALRHERLDTDAALRPLRPAAPFMVERPATRTAFRTPAMQMLACRRHAARPEAGHRTVHPAIAVVIPRPVAVMAIPVRPDEERHHRKADRRAIIEQRLFAAVVRIAEQHHE